MARKTNPHLSHRLDFIGYVIADLAVEAKAYLEGRGFSVTLASIPASHRPKNMAEAGDRELYVSKGKGPAALKAMQRKYGG